MKRSFTIHDLCLCALFTAVMAVCAWVTVPTPVPFTLQSLGLFVTLAVLGGKRGLLTVAAYLLLGVAGAPVFAGFRGGPAVLLDTTDGYLTGFLLAALLYLLLHPHTTRGKVLALALGQGLCYLFGTAWFTVLYTHRTGAVGLETAFLWCVVPFLLPDAVKLWLAILISSRLQQKGRKL